jgi:hypothetical protein
VDGQKRMETGNWKTSVVLRNQYMHYSLYITVWDENSRNYNISKNQYPTLLNGSNIHKPGI